ncbi:site-specific integrase [uncultured Duncaniella sp.]|jgi:integrase|uniref:tyrosine-type recombinase/integrase n=3 Tax=uncultured Duncaniella sp. TaxID=2768039 RepID=UPI0027121185|nr:site-specific integrase [uncultured Duncaniella sp.]
MSKKMCSKNFSSHKKSYNNPNITLHSGVQIACQFTLPTYRENEGCDYIEFYAYDPARGKMRRKRIKLNRIKGITNRRTYARGVMKRLTEQLNKGWNPWIVNDTSDLTVFEEAVSRYEAHIEKMLASGYFRKETYSGYKSYVKIMREYISKKNPIYYAYQFDRKFCVDFLDYVFIERDNGAQTRNNYLNFLRVFCGFLVDKGYLDSKPTDGISPISKRLYKKERECIPLEVVGCIAEYCREKDPEFLFACYLLYYCFIRPVEMTRIKVRHFNLKACTLTIPGELSKNKVTQTITLPKKVIQYGIDLGVFSAPMEYFIFSYRLRPGEKEIDPKHFRDHWDNVRRALKLKREWKFYSLKDTGITEMCDKNVAPRHVKDQARHSSLAITDIYLQKSASKAPGNRDIIGYDGAL